MNLKIISLIVLSLLTLEVADPSSPFVRIAPQKKTRVSIHSNSFAGQYKPLTMVALIRNTVTKEWATPLFLCEEGTPFNPGFSEFVPTHSATPILEMITPPLFYSETLSGPLLRFPPELQPAELQRPPQHLC